LEPIDTGFQCLIRILMVINFLISWTNLVLFMHCFVTATAIQLIWCFAPTKRGYLTSAVLAFVAGVGCVYMGVELFPLFTSADARRLTEHRLDPRGDDDGCYYDDDDYYDNIFGRIVDVEKIDAALEVSTATDCEFGTTEILRSIGCDETVVGAFAAFGSGALWFMVVDCILRIVKASWREAATRRDYRSSDGESDGGGGGGGAADRSVGLESDDEGDLIVRRALMVVAEGFAATVADHDRTAETARLDSSWQEPAQGLDDDDDDDDDDDGDDDDGSATTTTTTAAAGTSSSASSCLARIATDRSEKNRAQQVHVSKRIQDARDRAVVVVVAKNNNNTLTTIQPSLLLDDNNNNNSNSNSNNNTNSSGGEAMMALAPKPEWRIGATPQRNNVTTNATTNVSSSSSSSLPSSSAVSFDDVVVDPVGGKVDEKIVGKKVGNAVGATTASSSSSSSPPPIPRVGGKVARNKVGRASSSSSSPSSSWRSRRKTSGSSSIRRRSSPDSRCRRVATSPRSIIPSWVMRSPPTTTAVAEEMPAARRTAATRTTPAREPRR